MEPDVLFFKGASSLSGAVLLGGRVPLFFFSGTHFVAPVLLECVRLITEPAFSIPRFCWGEVCGFPQGMEHG